MAWRSLDDTGMVVAYADGACLGNGKDYARGGVGVYYGPNHALWVLIPNVKDGSNQRVEIQFYAETSLRGSATRRGQRTTGRKSWLSLRRQFRQEGQMYGISGVHQLVVRRRQHQLAAAGSDEQWLEEGLRRACREQAGLSAACRGDATLWQIRAGKTIFNRYPSFQFDKIPHIIVCFMFLQEHVPVQDGVDGNIQARRLSRMGFNCY